MTIVLRDYQRRGVNAVMRHWKEGTADSVLLVSPTGSGKTVMLEEIVTRARAGNAKVWWLCHRDQLVAQARAELDRRHRGDVGCVHPDYPSEPVKPIQIATVQSFLARGVVADAQLLVVDECHHYAADEWGSAVKKFVDGCGRLRIVGATATPERSDGRPLGDMFQAMVVAAQYGTLIAAGDLLDCVLWYPPADRSGLAMSPVDAYLKHGGGQSGFVFTSTVEEAEKLVKDFAGAGVRAAAITTHTKSARRKRIISDMKVGLIKLIVNVYTMTEGVNITNAKVCILARGCGSLLTYIQMVGRVLRPHRDHAYATVIDLSGASLKHGFPTEDREFSLEGEHGVTKSAKVDALRQCLACGFVWKSSKCRSCPNCGWVAPSEDKTPHIYNAELRKVYRGDMTPDVAKESELARLKLVAEDRGLSVGWVVRQYRLLFKGVLPRDMFTPDELDEYYQLLLATAYRKGRKTGWAKGCYKSTFGVWPGRY